MDFPQASPLKDASAKADARGSTNPASTSVSNSPSSSGPPARVAREGPAPSGFRCAGASCVQVHHFKWTGSVVDRLRRRIEHYESRARRVYPGAVDEARRFLTYLEHHGGRIDVRDESLYLDLCGSGYHDHPPWPEGLKWPQDGSSDLHGGKLIADSKNRLRCGRSLCSADGKLRNRVVVTPVCGILPRLPRWRELSDGVQWISPRDNVSFIGNLHHLEEWSRSRARRISLGHVAMRGRLYR
jgi:hypothetical protein